MPFDVEFVRQRLLDRAVEWHERVESTMTLAAARVEQWPHGSIVGAEEQTAGQGRHGRAWYSEPESGLYCTFLLHVPAPPEDLPVVTLALGLAVADTLRLIGGLPCDLRWPNDVLVDDRKVAGILTQLQDGVVLAGIGVNVNQHLFPPDLAVVATSLYIETGREHRREPMLVYLAGAIDSYVRILASSGVNAILSHFSAASSYVEGRPVYVDAPEGVIEGVTCGLTPEGFLRVRQDDGSIATIHAGGVRPAGL